MRTSLKKLRAFSISPGTKRNPYAGDTKPPLQPQFDELSHASQDVREMKEFYESLISAAAATSNSAYEFSESLKDMGDCLLEKTAVNDDEERGRVMLMLGKVQFKLQKLADNYRSHVVRTIQNPSESLIAQLETLEDMKRQCDDKRSTYQDMLSSYRENGRSKCHNKTENISYKQLEAARDEYQEETNLFAFRLKSLKGAQSHSLLTQASRHHAAQLCFFKRALKSLQLIEPDVKLVAEEQHIDYQFCELEDDEDDNTSYMEEESIDNDGNSEEVELSFDFGQFDEKEKDMTVVVSSSPGKSMELEDTGYPSPPVGAVDVVKEKLDSKGGLRFPMAVCRENKIISQSAPILSTKKADHVPQRFAQLRQSSSSKKKNHSYVLPTPDEMKNSDPRGVDQKRTFFNYLHSSPLQQNKFEETQPVSVTVAVAVPTNRNIGASTPFPPPLDEKLMRPRIGTYNPEQERKKIRRMAFSGPLNKPSSVNGPVFLKGKPLLLFSGPLFNNSKVLSSSTTTSSPPKLSPGSSPTRGSVPIISELHELPRPPTTHHHHHQLVHSGPLLSTKKQGSPIANKLSGSKMMPPPLLLLPPPPQTVPRSFSVPSNVKRVVSTSSEESRNATKIGIDLSSPPLTPILLPILHPATGT